MMCVYNSFLFELINGDDDLNFNVDHDSNVFLTNSLDHLIQDTYTLTVLTSNVDDRCQCGKTTIKITVLPSNKMGKILASTKQSTLNTGICEVADKCLHVIIVNK